MNKLPKAWKWIIGAWVVILLATLTFKYFTDWRYPVPVDSPIEISLSKGVWPGPTYKLTIYGDGTVVYEGEMFVGTVGTRKIKIDVQQVRDLADKIEQAGFFELEDYYYPKVFDAGYVAVSAKIGQKEKTVVRIDPGFIIPDFKIPDTLYQVEDAIAEIVDTSPWVDCNIKPRALCGFSPLAPTANMSIFGLTLWMVWGFIQRHKTFIGILLGFGIFLVHGVFSWNANWSFPTKLFSDLFVAFEVVAILPASLILVWRHKRKTKVLDSERA